MQFSIGASVSCCYEHYSESSGSIRVINPGFSGIACCPNVSIPTLEGSSVGLFKPMSSFRGHGSWRLSQVTCQSFAVMLDYDPGNVLKVFYLKACDMRSSLNCSYLLLSIESTQNLFGSERCLGVGPFQYLRLSCPHVALFLYVFGTYRMIHCYSLE